MSKDSRGYQSGSSRSQLHLLPPSIEEYVADNSAVRFIEVFVESLDLSAMQFTHHTPAATGRPPYDPKMLLSLYIYGYLYRIESSRRLETEAKRNLEVMWLLHQLQPDFKTIARFRSENAAQFELVLKAFNKACTKMALFSREVVAVDGSKFKAVNSKDRYFKRQDIVAVVPAPRTTSGCTNAGEQVFDLKVFTYDKDRDLFMCPAGMELARKSTEQRHGATLGAYYNKAGCKTCSFKPQCTTGQYRRLKRREDQEVIDRAAGNYQAHRKLFSKRKALVEHVFGTWRNKGQGRFLQRGITKIRGELQLMALAYNIGRVIRLKGVTALIEKIKGIKEELKLTKVAICLFFTKRGCVCVEF